MTNRLHYLDVSTRSIQQVRGELCLEMFDYGNTYMRGAKRQLDNRLKAIRADKAHEAAYQEATRQCKSGTITRQELVIMMSSISIVIIFYV